jgi:hypothetical protein
MLPFLFGLALVATAPRDQAARAEDVAAAKSALESLGTGLVLLGSATRDEGNDSFAAGGVQIMNGNGGAPEFTGAFELVLTKEGELCAVSSSLLPEIAVFDSGERRVVRTTVDETPLSVSQLATDLSVLLERPRLVAALEKATVRTEGDGRTISCELPARLFRATSSGLADIGQPRVKSAVLALTLDKSGALEGLRLRVTRNDPFAGLRKKALSGELGTDGGGNVTVTPGDLEAEDAQGAVSTYELRRESRAPSARAEELLRTLRALASKS